MPRAVEAVFIQARSGVAMVSKARQFHRNFLEAYALDARTVPLLLYHWQRAVPFSLFDGAVE